jgi:hypothetical protein
MSDAGPDSLPNSDPNSGSNIDEADAEDLGTHLGPLMQGLRRGEILIAMVLLVQYLVGMVVNLFVTIPDQHPGANDPNYFGGVMSVTGWAMGNGGAWLAIHTGVGLLLVVMSIGLVVQSIRARSNITLCVLGAVFILGAGFNGGSFLVYNQDFSSMIMAGLWALAMACYVGCIYLSAPRRALEP